MASANNLIFFSKNQKEILRTKALGLTRNF